MLRERHGFDSLPLMPLNTPIVTLTITILKAACIDKSTILSPYLAEFYLFARKFWSNVFSISASFTGGSAVTWNDIKKNRTAYCMFHLVDCIRLLGVWMQCQSETLMYSSSADHIFREYFFSRVFTDVMADGSGGVTLPLSPLAGASGATSSLQTVKTNQGQGGAAMYPGLTMAVKQRIMEVYDHMNTRLRDHALQLASRNEINCLCTVLIRTERGQVSPENVKAKMEEILAEFGRI